MSEPKPTIVEVLSRVLDDARAVGKNRANEQQRYKFRGIEDVYNALHPVFAKHGVITVPRVLKREHYEGTTKSGTINYRTVLEVEYRFYGPAGDYIEAVVTGEGSDMGDKSCNKAMSAAHKYALTQVLALPFVDVEEGDRTTPEPNMRKAPGSGPKLPEESLVPALEGSLASVAAADALIAELSNVAPLSMRSWYASRKAAISTLSKADRARLDARCAERAKGAA